MGDDHIWSIGNLAAHLQKLIEEAKFDLFVTRNVRIRTWIMIIDNIWILARND